MTVSKKQLEANRKNGHKGGVKTAEGKAITKYNALKHGLLAKEIVVTTREGAEDATEFHALSQDLNTRFQPQGPLEEMLVEKIAVAYWRLRRAYRYEAGLICRELDGAAEKYYGKTKWDGEKEHRTEEKIDAEIVQEGEHRRRIEALELEKEKNQQKIEVLKVLGNVPTRDELDRLLRYEGAIERQFDKALNQLERLQWLRTGDHVPAPVEVDVHVNTTEAA